MAKLKKIPGFCALCRSRCGSVSVVENGVYIRQEPNPGHPTGKALCVKGKAAAEIVNNSQRLTTPLKRTSPKGSADPGWVPIGWDEALALVAERIQPIKDRHGAEAVAFSVTSPSGSPISDGIKWIERLVNVFGSPNLARGTEICNWHKDFSHSYTFGRGIGSPDFRNSSCIVLWGHNPSATWLDHATAVAEAKARGASLIVIDPRKTGFASRAEQWVRVRPGSDGALALSVANEMIRTGGFRRDFVARWTNGPFLVRPDSGHFLRRGDFDNVHPQDLVALDPDGAMIFYDPATRTYRQTDCVPELFRDANIGKKDGKTLHCRTAFALYADLCAQYDADRTESVTTVPASVVRETAAILSAAGPVSYYTWSGISQHVNATQTDRAIAMLFALTGSFDDRGGNVDFTHHKVNDLSGNHFLSAEQLSKCISAKTHPLGPAKKGWIGSDALYRAILNAEPYAIKALVGFGANLVLSHASPELAQEALSRLDFFVQCDVVMTPTAALADLVLPVNTPWEREALRVGFEVSQEAEELIQFRPAAVSSLGESRSDAWIVVEMAKRLGLKEFFFDGDIESEYDHILEPTGINLDQLKSKPEGIRLPLSAHYRKYESTGFNTPTGRIEIYSEQFAQIGYDPLPIFHDGLASFNKEAGKSASFPLILTSAKLPYFCHSQHRHISSLRKRMPEPEVTMSPAVADQRGIADGDQVEIATDNGRAVMTARIDPLLDPRVVFAQYGWWQGNDELELAPLEIWGNAGKNFNILIADKILDPISGSAPHRAYPCDVRLVQQPGRSQWLPFRVARVVAEAEGMTSLYVEPAVSNGTVPPFKPGQFTTIRFEDEIAGMIVRNYSISSSPTEDRFLRITVKNVGKASGIINGGRMQGRLVDIKAGAGSFHLPDNLPRPVVMIAGGVGITPFISMIHALARNPARPKSYLFYGIRSFNDFAFEHEIAEAIADCPWIEVKTFVSDPSETLRNHCTAGRISYDRITNHIDGEADFYLCGPSPMIQSICKQIEAAGIDPRFIHTEAFGLASMPQKPLPPQRITLARSQRQFEWQSDKGSLLDQIEALGVDVSSGCRAGQCESCSVRCVSGDLKYPPGDKERSDDQCLLCIDRPLSELVLDV